MTALRPNEDRPLTPWPSRRHGLPGISVLVLFLAAAACDGSGRPQGQGAGSGPVRGDTATLLGPEEVFGNAPDRWTTTPEIRAGSADTALVVGVRTGTHPEYDRLVLEFRDRAPGYSVEYPAGDFRQCGSGDPVRTTARYALRVRLASAAAHDGSGSTLRDRAIQPGLDVLRSARVICDTDAVVEWVLEAGARAPFRVLSLEDPGRLVIDLKRDAAEPRR